MHKLLVATRNSRKLKEIEEKLKDIDLQLLTLEDIKYDEEIAETGMSFEENAILKAKTVGERIGCMTLAEDSGLEVDALFRRPGIYSARYVQGTDEDRIKRVLEELKGIPKEKRTARYKASAVLFDPKTKKIIKGEGITEGYITEKPIGSEGFGYDPIFYSFNLHKTFGEASLEEKNKVSHRGRALEKIKKLL